MNYTIYLVLTMEAPSGIEPLNRSFADCSLNHLGTAPSSFIIRSRFSSTQLGSDLILILQVIRQ